MLSVAYNVIILIGSLEYFKLIYLTVSRGEEQKCEWCVFTP